MRTRVAATFLGLIITGLSVGAIWLGANPPTEVPKATRIDQADEDLMRSKLTSSQNVLEGLCRNDFKLIAHGATEMKRISETAEWPRQRDPVYEHFSREFRRQCNLLESHAKARNRDAASFTYLHMTSICISCHDHVRDSRRVAGGAPRGDVQRIPSQWPSPAAASNP